MDREREVGEARLSAGRRGSGDGDEPERGSPPDQRVPSGALVREMIRHDQRTADHDRASTASADAVESVRLSIRDLKHDVRMLKVGLDKQTQMLDRISAVLARFDRPDQDG